ncbi:MAG: hypothetical protein ACKV0T_14990 [Planctomycetales bacterium]
MAEWELAQHSATDQLALLHFFSIKKQQPEGEIEFRITIKEFVAAQEQSMRFFAEADKQTNQRTAPYTPTGWGNTLVKALADCVRAIHRFPYEGPLGEKESGGAALLS